jgi:hypothetical protein
MKLPFRPLAMFTLGLLCVSACHPAAAGNPEPKPSLSVSEDAGPTGAAPSAVSNTVIIPGPLRSFLRMAGISQEVSPDEVLPLLARNASLRGYEAGTETEFLVLLNRYVQYARELRLLAGADGTISVAGCDDATKLIQVLGYEFQQTCGQKNAYLQTTNPERAFLTIDSGFPLTALEEALQKHTSFTYSFPATPLPVLFTEREWASLSSSKDKGEADLLDLLLRDGNIDRLYWALSKNDEETRSMLRGSLRALLPLAPALDFYGSQIAVRSGHVLVPGGLAAERGWEELAGANPASPVDFVNHLLTKDHGWLAAYFDALSRVSRAQQIRLTDGSHLKPLYDVYRRPEPGSSATRGVFAGNAELLMLFSRLQWQPGGEPYVPGSIGLWNWILTQNSSPELVRGWVRHADSWDSPDQLLLSLVACSRFNSSAGPLQTYLLLSAIDRVRPPEQRLSDQAVRLLAGSFPQFHSWYLIFAEFPTLNDTSITQFVNAAEAVNRIDSPALRANAMGAFQANVGLWQIVARQQQIPNDKINQSWQDVVQPFAAISSSAQLFDASRNSLRSLVVTVKGDTDLSQDQIIDMLAGPPQENADGRSVHQELAERMRSVLDDQRLVSLDTLFGLYDGLDEMAHGAAMRDQLVQLAGNLREFEMPRPIFTESEKISWAPGIYTSRHAELQVRTDLTKVIQTPGSAAQLEAARGQLTPFLRDTLVGLNYAYYEPPGAEALHHNPLFVRSHDFSGTSIQGYDEIWDPPELIGLGVTAGGGAYLIGSLADLPYSLALTEEDFIAPENVQALIWRAEGPALLASAVQPRWWGISPKELHAAALYQRSGEELLIASAQNTELRGRVTEILSDVMTQRRLMMTEQALLRKDSGAALIAQITPAEKFYLAAEFRRKFLTDAVSTGAAGRELDDLVRSDPSETNPARLSRDFGVLHPTLAQTNASGILNVKPFPAFKGSPYRLLGESWESTNLYWARMADEMGYSATALNLLVPELTRHMIANIFATDLEDWPALLRAMEQTGKEFQEGKITIAAAGAVSHH